MSNFVDFMVDVLGDKEKLPEVMEKINTLAPGDLSHYFEEKGYTISPDECKKLIDSKQNTPANPNGSGHY